MPFHAKIDPSKVQNVRLVTLPPGISVKDLKIGKGGQPIGNPNAPPGTTRPSGAPSQQPSEKKGDSGASDSAKQQEKSTQMNPSSPSAPSAGINARKLTLPPKQSDNKRKKAEKKQNAPDPPKPQYDLNNLFQSRSGATAPASAGSAPRPSYGSGAGISVSGGAGGDSGAQDDFGGPYDTFGSLEVDAETFRFLYYQENIKERISATWLPPSGLLERGQAKSVTVYFVISRTGVVRDVKIEKSSNIELLDLAAIRAIQAAAPFLPLPVEFAGDYLGVHFCFESKL